MFKTGTKVHREYDDGSYLNMLVAHSYEGMYGIVYRCIVLEYADETRCNTATLDEDELKIGWK